MNGDWNFNGLLSFSERIPSVSEQFGYYLFSLYDGFDYLGNPTLGKEGLLISQITVDHKKSDWRFKGSIYRFDFFNYIMGVADMNLNPMTMGASGVKKYANIGNARIMGIEFNLDSSISDKLNLNNTFGYSHGADSDKEPLPMIPPLNTQLSLDYQWNSIKISPGAVWTASQRRTSKKFNEAMSDPFFLLNLKVRKNLNLGKGGLSVTMGPENILDKKYMEHLDWGGIPRQGRNFYANCSWNF